MKKKIKKVMLVFLMNQKNIQLVQKELEIKLQI